jgi:hypothetical protein
MDVRVLLGYVFGRGQPDVKPFAHPNLADRADQPARSGNAKLSMKVACRMARTEAVQVHTVVQDAHTMRAYSRSHMPAVRGAGNSQESRVLAQVVHRLGTNSEHVAQMPNAGYPIGGGHGTDKTGHRKTVGMD